MSITNIKENMNVAKTLRGIADDIDVGELQVDNATLIMGTEVYHMGTVSDQTAVMEAVWNMNFGITKLMAAALGVNNA